VRVVLRKLAFVWVSGAAKSEGFRIEKIEGAVSEGRVLAVGLADDEFDDAAVST